LLAPEFSKPYFERLADFVRSEYTAAARGDGPPVYPAARNVFRAFDMCGLDELKAVLIGQDPYHGPGQANGLCFSVGEGVPFPPSLRNIFKEVAADIGTPPPPSGDLSRWARQGVLLLNAGLTVRQGQPNSHADSGWHTFTDAVVAALGETKRGVVYMLWGAFAQRRGERLDAERNCILRAPHPSPLSAHSGFLGCRHFSKANEYLINNGKTPIEW
jgi:uracil-DNA glycosylase